MHRLDRRIQILRGKREGAFDPDQYFLEQATRARAARHVRSLLRRNVPVLLVAPRWSEPRQFLDDVGVDLSVGRPRVQCRTLSMAPMLGKSVHEGWTWIVRAVIEFCGLHVSGPVSQAVDRHGFRFVMRDMFYRARGGPRRALLIHQLEHLPVDARDDLVEVFEEHMDQRGADRRLNLLLATGIDSPTFDMKGAARVVLPDFGKVEAVDSLVEHTGPMNVDELRRAVETVGGVPSLLQSVGNAASARGGVARNRDELWRALGPFADEVRSAVAIVSAHEALAERFELVARDGPVATDPDRDAPLLRAGVIAEVGGGKVMIRAPLFAELALGG